ncbi:RING zinc finger protein, putative [Plasmodium ovale curtisi]|uniref:RING zinc finger protein, putative n=1 Tax=Plasmodium ovale curtisi TaxID=864141 RepID=A0A1A8VTK0_PLAOA|nr:RING zinc finger protein, putative [Plasmodium ovale curtisi]
MVERAYERVQANVHRARLDVMSTINDIKMDGSYIQNVRWNLKKQVDILMNRFFPINKKEDEKRFVVIIEKKKNYDNFRCPICMLVLFKPVKTKCAHIFCQECIEKVLKNFDYCPMCRENIKDFKLESVRNSFLGIDYGSIKIRCWKCKQVTSIKNYEKHLKNHTISDIPVSHTHVRSVDCTHNSLRDTINDTQRINIEPTDLFFHKLDSFFNRKIKIDDMQEFLTYVRKTGMDTDNVHSVHLLFGTKRKDKNIYEVVDVEDITCDVFFLIKLKRKKIKKRTVRRKEFICDKGDRGNMYNDPFEKRLFRNRGRKVYSEESYEWYQTKMVKKNRLNGYIYILFEYNAKNLFFTVMKNIPIFKNMKMTRMVTCKEKKRESHVDNRSDGRTDAPVGDCMEGETKRLDDIFSILRERKNAKTYHKYFHNSIHMFGEIIGTWTRNEGTTNFEKKDVHFRNNDLEDYELMFFLLYLRYEYTLPICLDYCRLYSKGFLQRILSRDRIFDYTVFVTDVYTYPGSSLGGRHGAKCESERRVTVGGRDTNTVLVLRVRRGRINGNEVHPRETHLREARPGEVHPGDVQLKGEGEMRNGRQYEEVSDVCYFLFLYSEKGFQWYVNKSVDFLKKKKIHYKKIKVHFDLDKLILFFFHIRRKKFSSIFWNSTHLLQYLLQFCSE